jgi:hypothetical protein
MTLGGSPLIFFTLNRPRPNGGRFQNRLGNVLRLSLVTIALLATFNSSLHAQHGFDDLTSVDIDVNDPLVMDAANVLLASDQTRLMVAKAEYEYFVGTADDAPLPKDIQLLIAGPDPIRSRDVPFQLRRIGYATTEIADGPKSLNLGLKVTINGRKGGRDLHGSLEGSVAVAPDGQKKTNVLRFVVTGVAPPPGYSFSFTFGSQVVPWFLDNIRDKESAKGNQVSFDKLPYVDGKQALVVGEYVKDSLDPNQSGIEICYTLVVRKSLTKSVNGELRAYKLGPELITVSASYADGTFDNFTILDQHRSKNEPAESAQHPQPPRPNADDKAFQLPAGWGSVPVTDTGVTAAARFAVSRERSRSGQDMRVSRVLKAASRTDGGGYMLQLEVTVNGQVKTAEVGVATGRDSTQEVKLFQFHE